MGIRNKNRQHGAILARGTTLLAAAALIATSVVAMAHSKKNKPLVLDAEGSFFVNGKVVTTNFPSAPATGSPTPGTTVINQMYVRYMIPEDVAHYWSGSNDRRHSKTKKRVPPVIMVHGSGHTGVTFETTPDGREGWANHFVRNGFPVYVVDHSGRARSGFDQTPINQAKVESNPALIPSLVKTTHEGAWVGFRIGPSYGVPYSGAQFPIADFDQYAAQLVPNTEVTLPGGGANSTDALVALLDKIGPAIIIAHSQGSLYALGATVARPNLVKGVLMLEGSCAATPAEIANAFVRSPFMAMIGDNRPPERNVQCQDTVNAINAAGGKATFFLLPAAGFKGNSHMMMMDKNSLKIADKVIDWLHDNLK